MLRCFLILCLILTTACSTIVSRKEYSVHINSNPADAGLVVKNDRGFEIYRGRTPAIVKLKPHSGYFKRGSYIFKFEKDGHAPLTYPLTAEIDGWYFGNGINMIFGTVPGLIGFFVVDPLTGAMWKLESDVNVNL